MHPLDPLTPDEILAASTAVRKAATTVRCSKFAYITLLEPSKTDVLKKLGIATKPEEIGLVKPDDSISIPRRADVALIDATTGKAYEATVLLDKSGVGHVEGEIKYLGDGVQPGITNEELIEAEEIVKADARVQELCAEVGIKPDQIKADGWSIGYESRFSRDVRLQQCFVYAQLEPHEHFYAHPLDFNVVVDANAGKVLHIDFAPHRDSQGKLSSKDAATAPPPLDVDALAYSGRDRISPPLKRYDYLPEFQKPDFYREPLKPLHIQQPQGVSFTLNGNELSWAQWKLHIGYSFRDGIVLNTIQYNDGGRWRPLIYRASMAEFVVPYGDPSGIHPRKFALDAGEYGLGGMANSLDLGCDCLGSIQYLDGIYSNHAGKAEIIKNAVCIHEEDAGVLFKHTDFRTGGKSHMVRSRKLVISFAVTVANYEYLLRWSLLLDGTIDLEVQLTGILQLYTMQEGEATDGFGTEVAERIMAHHHQHLFNYRIDPMIDGLANSVVEADLEPVAAPTGSVENWAGNGFRSVRKTLKTAEEGVRDWDASKTRSWHLINPSVIHKASKQPAGYKIMSSSWPRMLGQPDSFVAKRTPFARHNFFAVPYAPDRLYPAGKHVTQTIATPADALDKWSASDESIENRDLIVFVTFGINHVVRPEDFPIMPSEHVNLTLKPVSFFEMNPALDVPATKDSKSVLVNGHSNGHANGACH